MSMKPILFSGPMVRAILEKQNPKTQTRRVAQTKGASVCDSAPLQDLNWCGDVVDDASHLFEHGDVYLKVPDAGTETRHRVFPKYKKSDILWVRETWREWDESDEIDDDPEEFREWRPRTDPLPACMRADCGELEEEQREAGLKWRPSIFMPKWACRLFLEVENIRAERVANLTTSDAYAEGVAHYVRTAEFKGLNINSDRKSVV